MTMLTKRYSDAVDYARIAHAGQIRKGSNIPYLYHLLAVSSLVLEYGGNEDQAIAGLLHDVLEECGALHEDVIRSRFGEPVAAIVKDCTDGTAEQKAVPPEDKKRNWWERKLKYLAHLHAEPDASLLVSGCDKLHNARAIVADLSDPGVGLAVFDRFTGGRDGTLRYYEAIALVLASRNAPMARVFDETVARMHELAGARERLPLSHGVYRLKVYDNYHYMQEDEVWYTGFIFGADEALAQARAMVDDTINQALAAGESPEQALSTYKSFGDDPVIIGIPAVAFSAWSYAESRCSDAP